MTKQRSKPSHVKVPIVGIVIERDGNRVIDYKNIKFIRHFLNTKCKVGDEIHGEFTSKRPKRTAAQNNFAWLYCSLISESSGHTPEEIYYGFESIILTKGITELYGHKIRKCEKAKELNISEFCEWMNRIQEITEIPIPDPKPFKLPLTKDEYGKLRAIQKEEYRAKKSNLDMEKHYQDKGYRSQ